MRRISLARHKRDGRRRRGHGPSGAKPDPAPVCAPSPPNPEARALSQIRGQVALVEQWAGYLDAIEGKAARTICNYRLAVYRFLEDEDVAAAIGLRSGDELDVSRLTRAHVEGHLKRMFYRGLGRAGQETALIAVRSWCRYLMGHGLLATNPTVEIATPKAYRREIAVLTPGEVKRFLFGPKGKLAGLPRNPLALRDLVMFVVQYDAGLRSTEVGMLRTDGCQWHDDLRLMSVLVERAKAADEDVRQLLGEDASRLLGAYLEKRPAIGPGPWLFPSIRGGRLDRGEIARIFHARRQAHGIELKGRRLTPHKLRHSLATHLLDSRWDIRTVQHRLRHTSLESTAIYLHTTRQREARLLRRQAPLGERRERQPEVQSSFRAFLEGIRDLSGS